MNIPSPRQLNLKRFERPDFRATTPRGKHAQGWTWTRAMYRLRSWLARSVRNTTNDVLATVRQLNRALMSLRAARPVRRPELVTETHHVDLGHVQVNLVHRSTPRQPGPLRRFVRQVGRRSAPVRRHRLEDLSSLPHAAYLTALTARQRYVTANLLKLKGLSTQRAFGETTWKESRRADRYATA